MTISEFLNMGGYGQYVWAAYCITLIVFGINVVITFQEKRRIKKLIKGFKIPTATSGPEVELSDSHG